MASIENALTQSRDAFLAWRNVPAPACGELVRLFGEELRASKAGARPTGHHRGRQDPCRGLGEVQEMIDICDFRGRPSRQLYGLTIASEARPAPHDGNLASAGRVGTGDQRLQLSGRGVGVERRAGAGLRQQRGLEAVGKTPLTALATQALFDAPWRATAMPGRCRAGWTSSPCSARGRGATLVDRQRRGAGLGAPAPRAWAARRATAVGARFARSILELGGNNAASSRPAPTFDLARAVTFAASRHGRPALHDAAPPVRTSVHDALVPRLQGPRQARIGTRLTKATLVGPLIDAARLRRDAVALAEARERAGHVTGGERVMVSGCRWRTTARHG